MTWQEVHRLGLKLSRKLEREIAAALTTAGRRVPIAQIEAIMWNTVRSRRRSARTLWPGGGLGIRGPVRWCAGSPRSPSGAGWLFKLSHALT